MNVATSKEAEVAKNAREVAEKRAAALTVAMKKTAASRLRAAAAGNTKEAARLRKMAEHQEEELKRIQTGLEGIRAITIR